jgi:hypothetical protein
MISMGRVFIQEQFPQQEYLGRITDPKVEIKVRPDIDSQTAGVLYEDAVVHWLREVIGSNPYRINQRFVETPEGYIWSPLVQPVRHEPNSPIDTISEHDSGPGLWVQVSVPWVEVNLENSSPYAPSIKYELENNRLPRLRYSQIVLVDDIKTDELGQTWYRISEPYGSYGDIFWGPAEAFKPIVPEDITPIAPDVEKKRIDINLNRQTLSCYEDESEVFFCRISSGKEGGKSATPTGDWYRIWRKLVSVHMSGGTTGGGYDLAGIGWTTLFITGGIAIHSTYWHNNFGVKMSHGCINARPKDAHFIFCWTLPIVAYDPGDITITSSDQPSTRVRVIEG